MGVGEVISLVIQVLAQLGLLTVIQAMAVILVVAAVILYFVKR